jgi:hypothetical protein
MNLRFVLSSVILGVALIAAAIAQDPNTSRFVKDGLSFDYPKSWQLSDQSTAQMQLVELTQGDITIRIRSPREYLSTPEKVTHAKKLFQDNYVNDFVTQVQGAGMSPKRSVVTTQIAGADAEGARVRAILGGDPGGMDSYFRVVSDRLINLSIIGSEKDITNSAAAWDLIRNSIQVEAAPQPKSTGKPSPTPKP